MSQKEQEHSAEAKDRENQFNPNREISDQYRRSGRKIYEYEIHCFACFIYSLIVFGFDLTFLFDWCFLCFINISVFNLCCIRYFWLFLLFSLCWLKSSYSCNCSPSSRRMWKWIVKKWRTRKMGCKGWHDMIVRKQH